MQLPVSTDTTCVLFSIARIWSLRRVLEMLVFDVALCPSDMTDFLIQTFTVLSSFLDLDPQHTE